MNPSPKSEGQDLFITLEGIEGSGKTTQTDLLYDYFRKRKIPVLCTREPGGTRIGQHIRSILLQTLHTELDSLAELCLIIADRAQHVQEVISPALLANEVVLCDRYMDATVAYQGFGRGLEMALIEELNRQAVNMCVPDLTVLLDCQVDVGLRRVRQRLQTNRQLVNEQRFEMEEGAFHQRVREGYLWISQREPERMKVLDGTLPPEQLHEQVVDLALSVMKRSGIS
jgi:dTMP kinase